MNLSEMDGNASNEVEPNCVLLEPINKAFISRYWRTASREVADRREA